MKQHVAQEHVGSGSRVAKFPSQQYIDAVLVERERSSGYQYYSPRHGEAPLVQSPPKIPSAEYPTLKDQNKRQRRPCELALHMDIDRATPADTLSRQQDESRNHVEELKKLKAELQQEDSVIHQHQVRKAELQERMERIERWQLGLGLNGGDPLEIPLFLASEGVQEPTSPMSGTTQHHGDQVSLVPCRSGNTTVVGHNDSPGPDESVDLPTRNPNPQISTAAGKPDEITSWHQKSPKHSLSKRSSIHLDTVNPPKRKRYGYISAKRASAAPILHQDHVVEDAGKDAAATFNQPELTPVNTTSSLGRSRLSQVLHGSYGKKVTCDEINSGFVVTNSNRPTSYPLARRWRRSIGLSIKSLTTKLEDMKCG